MKSTKPATKPRFVVDPEFNAVHDTLRDTYIPFEYVDASWVADMLNSGEDVVDGYITVSREMLAKYGVRR